MITNLKGFSQCDCYVNGDNLTGFFSYDGKNLTDQEIRTLVEYGISHGYTYDSDIPSHIVEIVISHYRNPKNNEKIVQLTLF
jgi:hypothetical protein